MKNSIRSFASVIFIAVLVTFSLAQTNRGGISGTVSDKNGGVVPGATVTITNVGTNQSQKLTTSAEGSYAAASLEPVVYRITVEAPGFKKSVADNIKVNTASVATVNVALEPGAVETVVNITAETPLLNNSSGTTGHTINERQIQDVPLLNRSVLDLALTVANVSGDAGSEDPEVTSGQPVPGFNLSLNGGRPGSTAILADGVNNTGVGIARTVVSFTPETVQEFTVQTSAYSAEFGQTGGGVINVTTKSGTNSFNGVALWYHRNPITNARPFRTGGGPRPPLSLRYNQGSLSFGGPIWLPKKIFGPASYDGRNKSFFFFAYEPRYRRDFVTVATLLPTAAERAGDFSNLRRTASGWLPESVAAQFNQPSTGPTTIYQQFTRDAAGRLLPIALATGQTFQPFADNKIPQAWIDPASQRILQFMPTGGNYFADDAGLIRNFIVNRFVRQDETRYTLRLDHNVTAKNKVNFRITTTPTVGVRGFGSDVNGSTGVYGDAKQILISDNHIFTPTLINEARVNYTRGVFSEDFSPEFSIKGGRNLATELGLPSLTAGGIPLFQISGDGGYNAFTDIGSSGSTNNFNVEERFNINDIVYWTRGSMTWKFGVDLNHARLNVVPFFAASGGRWQFRAIQTNSNRGNNVSLGGNPLASLLIGVPNVVDVRPLLLDYNYRWNSGAAFVQNDWKVRPNLTLNLGMRYSLQYPRSEKNNLQGVFRTDLAQTVTLTDTQRRAIATGVGVATTAAIPTYVPTSAQIPAFAFAGMGGRSKYIVGVDYLNFEPRFGFAWNPKAIGWLASRNAVVRGGYGISHAPLTGNNRSPNPDYGSFTQVTSTATGSSGTADAAQPVRLSSNPPRFSGLPLSQALGIPDNGLLYTNSIAVPGFVDSQSGNNAQVPYTQNWNLSLSFEPQRNTVLEFAYVGNKGTHLYLPLVNVNPRDIDFVEFLEANAQNADTAFNDPLGRRNLLGATITVQRGSVLSPYLGFGNLNKFFDPSANSIRHAGYVDVRRRVRNGLTFTANYTFAKSIDDASDASPDTRVLSSGQTQGQVSYGAPRYLDRSLSTFDIKHNFTATYIWDLPVGKGRSLMKDAPAVVNAAIGGWTLSGVVRLQGGNPLLPYLTDTNRLGGVNRTIRPDLVNGVSLLNPLWDRNCPFGVKADNTPCEPYINPAAFIRPAKGSLGTAPRTLDVRAPMQRYFDFSLQKNFPLGKDSKRRINFRVDMLNAFNHPNFRLNNLSGTSGFTGSGGGLPNEALFTAAELTTWLAANPGKTATLDQVNNLIIASRLPNGTLPLNFFSVNLPEGFTSRVPNSFDLMTLNGIKLFRLRQNYDAGFGSLREVNQPRYIQFGIRIFF
ncbi:MAG: carboxypeptidase regulatory-like domain-containing protein [Blastocatellia bacterium]